MKDYKKGAKISLKPAIDSKQAPVTGHPSKFSTVSLDKPTKRHQAKKTYMSMVNFND